MHTTEHSRKTMFILGKQDLVFLIWQQWIIKKYYDNDNKSDDMGK